MDRMVLAYYYAQILPISRQRPGGGNLLVLASANCGKTQYLIAVFSSNAVVLLFSSDERHCIRFKACILMFYKMNH
jgi:hypothetical protein